MYFRKLLRNLTPPVTVILPAFNAEAFIADAIESVRRQTFAEWTLLVMDDGSTDGTRAIAIEACGRDPRCTVVPGEHRGLTVVLRDAVAAVQSPWVARLDADDYMMSDRLDRQIRAAQNGRYVVLGSAVFEWNQENREASVVQYPLTDAGCREMLAGFKPESPFAHPAVLMNREAVLAAGNYDAKYDLSQDLDLWLRMARRPGWLGNLDTPMTVRNIHSAQRSNRTWRRRWNSYRIALNTALHRRRT